MKDDSALHLLRKYEAGESTLEEERELLRTAKESGHTLEAWSEFVRSQQPAIPEDLKRVAWSAITDRQRKLRRNRWVVAGVAASLSLLVAFTFLVENTKTQDYQTKRALLDEAIALVAQSQQTEVSRNIIYEDELIIIYTN